jgi:hypothetical protein
MFQEGPVLESPRKALRPETRNLVHGFRKSVTSSGLRGHGGFFRLARRPPKTSAKEKEGVRKREREVTDWSGHWPRKLGLS